MSQEFEAANLTLLRIKELKVFLYAKFLVSKRTLLLRRFPGFVRLSF
jgi:hypothetical protein